MRPSVSAMGMVGKAIENDLVGLWETRRSAALAGLSEALQTRFQVPVLADRSD